MSTHSDPATQILLPHGYTMIDLHKMTLGAIVEARWRVTPFDERYEVARFAIIERLYDENEPAPQWRDLVRTGKRAIKRFVDDEFCEHGQDLKSLVLSDVSRPRFCTYWWDQSAPTPSPEQRIVDILAVCQIWPRLTPRNKRILRMLAVHGDYDSAARALGVTRNTYVAKLSEARKQFLRLWHEGEQPSRIWGRDHKGIFDYEAPQGITTITVRQRRAKQRARAHQKGTPAP
jgi:DNA-binding CsgD family transcriptional regulator